MSQKLTININTNILSRINNINKNSFAIFITLLFALVIGIGMHYHIMWKDELEEYLVIKHYLIPNNDLSYFISHSLIRLFLLISPTETMYLFVNSLIIILAIFIFVFYSPFKNIEKLLFAFNYYFVFEYGIIARFYCFMLLFIFLILFLISKVKRNYLLITILIIILATHNIYGTILAASLSLYLMLDVYKKYQASTIKYQDLYFASFVFCIGWLGTILIHYFFTIRLIHKYSENEATLGVSPILLTINNIWNAYIPIPDLTQKVTFWHTNIIPYTIRYPLKYNTNDYINSWNILAFIISIIILVISISKFSNKLIVLYPFLFNNIIYFIFLQYIYRVYMTNYIGPFFLIFIYSYWLYNFTDEKIERFKESKIQRFKIFFNLQKLFKPMLYIILIAQVFSASYAVAKTIKYKFTSSQDAADYIRQNNLQNTHIMVGWFWITNDHSICAHLDKKIFFAQSNNFEYCWYPGKINRGNIELRDIFNACTNFTEKQNKKVLLISNNPLTYNKQIFTGQAMLSQKSNIKFIQSITGEVMIPDEQYWLYEINKTDTSFNNCYSAIHDYVKAFDFMDIGCYYTYAPKDPVVLNARGYFLYVQGQYKEAIKFLKKAIKQNPDYNEPYINLAKCYQALHYNDIELKIMDIKLKYAPNDYHAFNDKGVYLFNQGKYKEAMKFLTEVIQLKPDYNEPYFNLANYYNAIHNYDNALKIMDIILKYAPADYNALNNKGFYLFEQGKYKKAVIFLTEAIKLKPNYSEPYFNLINCYNAIHDYDNALKIMDIRLKYAPDDYNALNNKGFYLFEQGKYKEAVKLYNEAIQLKPDYSEAYFNLADCYNAMLDYDNAIKIMDIMLKYAPDDYNALNNKGYYLFEQGKYKEAAKIYNETIALKPDYSEAYFNLADCYNAMHDYDNGLKIMDIILKNAPDDYHALNNKGFYLFAQGKYKEAVKLYNEAIQLRPDNSEPYFTLAEYYQGMHDYDNAVKIIDIILKNNPNDYHALNNKGFYLFEQGKYKEAVKLYNEAIELKLDYSLAYINLAECYNAMHDYDNVLRTMDISLKYTPDDYMALNSKGYYLYEQGKYKEAVIFLRKAIKQQPDYTKAYINLADCYQALHEYNNALKIIDIGLKNTLNNYYLLNNKGVILYNQGKYKEAMTFYNEAIKLNPQYGDTYINIGSCYGRLQDYDKAIFYWRRSLEFNTDNTETYKMLGWAYQNKGDRVSADAYYAKAKK